ncbi:hypothetical protein IGB42_01876 [Andreprevotia sp. IGB-42]|uniref:DUF4339 domain-containing protein n=1 Tax=Andreprevotia sp. IGB-42 TaxID=2497473 RepID=UPI00135BAB85|nr:DUF4339 domain-containing protein [Andreprevotia sp. IGB-42]KAF0813525.1 hypothetical protein IGB42_01876 [Andreprevotia sp. IGB-42]
MKQWWYAKAGNVIGPIGEDVLKRLLQGKQITPATLVWRDGMPAWQALHAVAALQSWLTHAETVVPAAADSELAPAIPVPTAPVEVAATPTSNTQKADHAQPFRMRTVHWLGLAAVGCMVGIAMVSFSSQAPAPLADDIPTPAANTTVTPAPQPTRASSAGEAATQSWVNPQTGLKAQIDSRWQAGNKPTIDGLPQNTFTLDNGDALVLFATELSANSLETYVRQLEANNPKLHFDSNASTETRGGIQAWSNTAKLSGKPHTQVIIQISRSGNRYWRLLTFQDGRQEDTDAMLRKLVGALWRTSAL